ncbi:MAG: methyl-accepting chemotaxis protein [Agathobacter sp.]|nr:methyl-accepting chemotaxis protein [Agathobacter sp.]
MKKTDVKLIHSMRFRLLCLFVGGILLSSIILIGISIMENQKNTRQIVQSYMIAEARSNGHILDTVLSSMGDSALESADTLSQILSGVKLDGFDSSYAYLVSADGIMLYHPTAEKIGQPVENAVVTQLIADLGQGKIADPDCVEYEFKGVIKYASYYINPDGKYILVISADESDAFAAIIRTTNIMNVALIVEVILFAILGFIMINRLVKPLHVLTEVVNKVAGLDFTRNEDEDQLALRKDEIGLIGRAIHNLHGQLRDIIVSIRDQGEKLSQSNTQFVQGFSEIVQTVDNVNVAVEEIAMGSTSQAQETTSASENMVDMGNAIESNSTSVDALEESIDRMNSLAQQSEEMLDDLADINNKTAETIDVVTEQTNRTNQSAEKINEAVVAIQDIASQTNLLSLNASIEAARAGESGRGFAVVAEQIRKLSEDSANSATEIEAIVRELIENSEDSVVKMQNLKDGSAVQAEKLDSTKESFEGLKQEIEAVSNASKEIFTQTSSINKLKDGVSGVIEQLAAIAQENAASTQETSASMFTLTENIDKCKDETEVLAGLSNQLNEQTRKFKF